MKSHADRLVCNDFEDYSVAVNTCYLANHSEIDEFEYQECRDYLFSRIKCDARRGFISELYAPEDDNNIRIGERVFYTRRNAEFIDTARQHIDSLPVHMRIYFLAPLIVKASMHNNTAGVFKGFYKNKQGVGAFGGEGGHALKRILGYVDIPPPVLSPFECDVEVTNSDATRFASEQGGQYDVVYMDPPYNQHPYGSNYFMLNLILHYQRPTDVSKVSGIPVNWKRSAFNKRQGAKAAFFGVIDNLDAKFFLISYNSEGFLKKDDTIRELEQRGKLKLYETSYNTYRGSRNLSGRSQYVTEYLFLLEKR